ncbi:hypothetical protein KUCAC02_032798, partial [Chaenocephalus aceratus]
SSHSLQFDTSTLSFILFQLNCFFLCPMLRSFHTHAMLWLITHCVLSFLKQSPVCDLDEGIERLKGETGKWGKVPCWEAMQMAFGGPFSLSWCSPFAGLSCTRSPAEHTPLPQGDIIEEDIIEIPFT